MLQKLEHPDLEPFEPVLRRLLDLMLANGKNALATAGFRVQDIKNNEHAHRLFIRNVHYGYAQAQERAGKLVIDLEERVRVAEQELKAARRARDAGHAILMRIRVMRGRELVLRRMVDTIAMILLKLDTWILRRLILDPDGQIRRIDSKVMKRLLQVVADRNAQSRYRFSLICDLTTFIHIGDLVEVDRTPGRPGGWQIVELKEGKVNEILNDAISTTSDEWSQPLEEIRTTLGDKAARQARRMLVQQQRMENLDDIIRTDRGIDMGSKLPILVGPEPIFTEHYEEEIRRIVHAVPTGGVGAITIDQCLHLIGIRGDMFEKGGIGAIRHTFYHLLKPGIECKLSTADRGAEFEALRSVPLFVDLVSHSLYCQWGTSPFLWMAEEIGPMLDLLMGRVRLFALFDSPAFLDLAGRCGVKMTWITGKEAEEIKRISRRIPGSPGAWGVRTELPDGTTGKWLAGFVGRVIADVARPMHLIDVIKKTKHIPESLEA